MTFEKAVETIRENIGLIGIRNGLGDYIREFFIAPLDRDLFTEYMALYRIIRDHATVSDNLGINDFQVWVQITDYGLSTFVTLDEFLGSFGKG